MKTREIKLGDFGIAKVLQDTHNEPTELVGTPSYLAPELCRNEKYDARVDIWAIGIVLYEMITLSQPFLCSNIGATIFKIISGEPSPVPEACSAEVREVMSKTLDKNYENRPFAADLLRLPVVSACLDSHAQEGSDAADADDDDDDWEVATMPQPAGPLKAITEESRLGDTLDTRAGESTINTRLSDSLKGTKALGESQKTLAGNLSASIGSTLSSDVLKVLADAGDS